MRYSFPPPAWALNPNYRMDETDRAGDITMRFEFPSE
jgi:hypothetical protein